MGQIRLHYKTSKTEAEKLYQMMDAAFEDEAYPVAITEIDEAKEISEVSLYAEEAERDDVKERLAHLLSIAISAIDVEILPDIDWVSHSLAGLKPVRAGRFFVHGSHDREKIKEGDLAIEIDAGQAFGTGHHGTTAGCLDMITRVMRDEKPQNALDLGTGSGVLAIGVAMLQPIPVLATDIDPIAVDVAAQNFVLNGVSNVVTALTATGFSHAAIASRAPFDLIVANILANPLIELAPELVASLKAGGSVILSGILEEQHDRVLKAYTDQGLNHIDTLHREGWVTIHLK